MRAVLFLAVVSAPLAAEKPSSGKVKFNVLADATEDYKGVRQRSSELEESERDVRLALNKNDWLEVVSSAETADVRLRILGRRRDPARGFVLGYALDAGAFRTEDEFVYGGESVTTGGGRSRDAHSLNDDLSPRATKGWSTLAKKFAESLEGFAKANYDRIVAQRKP
jgi:hypothetical protein